LPEIPHTFSLTKYIGLGWSRIIIGENNDTTGLFGFYNDSKNSVGVSICRKFK